MCDILTFFNYGKEFVINFKYSGYGKKVPSKKQQNQKTVSKNDKVKFEEQLKHLDDSLKMKKINI